MLNGRTNFIAVTQKLVETTGRYMNLSNLDGITIGFDYDDALASVDLGYESTIAKQYTKQENLLGVGKALRVRRNGEIKMHVVLNGHVLLDLVEHEPTSDEFWGQPTFLPMSSAMCRPQDGSKHTLLESCWPNMRGTGPQARYGRQLISSGKNMQRADLARL